MSDRAPRPLYGTAMLLDAVEGELGTLFLPEGAEAAILGVNAPHTGGGDVWWPKGNQGHGLTLGATRSGKGVSAIIPALLTYNGSMVVIDPKGENAWVTAERRRQMGQRVVILDPWDEVNRRYGGGHQVEQVTRFNPLSAINPDDPDFNDEVAAVADALVVDEGGTGDHSHWTDSARELISGLVAAVVEMNPGGASLGDVRQLLALPSDELAKIIKEIAEERPGSLGERKLRRFAKDGREVDSIRSTALTQTAVLDSGTLRAAMETDQPPFDLAELATGRVTLYLVLPLDRLRSHGRWLRLILTLAIRVLARQAAVPAVPVMFMLDEFGTIGRLTMIEQAFGLMAGIGIRVWAFLQDLNQLKRDYPNSWESFVSNSSIIQVLNARDITTSQYISEYLGTNTVTIINTSTSDNKSAKLQAFLNTDHERPSFVPKTGDVGSSTSLHARPALLPHEVRALRPDELIIIRPGLGAAKLKPIIYHRDKRFQGMFRPVPWFPARSAAEYDRQVASDRASWEAEQAALRKPASLAEQGGQIAGKLFGMAAKALREKGET